jgi:hypothetical protein
MAEKFTPNIEHRAVFDAMRDVKEDARKDNLDWLQFLYLMYGDTLVDLFLAFEQQEKFKQETT